MLHVSLSVRSQFVSKWSVAPQRHFGVVSPLPWAGLGSHPALGQVLSLRLVLVLPGAVRVARRGIQSETLCRWGSQGSFSPPAASVHRELRLSSASPEPPGLCDSRGQRLRFMQDLTFDLSVRDSRYEWLPYGTRRYLKGGESHPQASPGPHQGDRSSISWWLYLWNFRPILLARACSSSTVCPQAALISFQSTGTLGRRPSRKLFMVPNWPLCLRQEEPRVSGQGQSSPTHTHCTCTEGEGAQAAACTWL